MFFPFNTGEQIFGESLNSQGDLKQESKYEGIGGTNTAGLNHYFGLTMTTYFKQGTDGETSQGKPITYEFSGDDDVWVFIDGVLVGDLGGIHDAASLSIDFASGKILINGQENGTLWDKFNAAGATGTTAWSDNGTTFKDDTLHTLKFFYLERGNVASNMNLKFNLVTVPESEVVKVDQEGKAIAGASFALYAAGSDYSINENAGVLAMGETNDQGRLTLINEKTDTLVTFEDLYNQNGRCEYFVLRETGTPAGYRSSGDIHIRYAPGTGVVYCENYWDTGAFANAREQIAAPNQILTREGVQIVIQDDKLYLNNEVGSLYAVVLHREAGGEINDPTSWRAVYGSSSKGWKLTGGTTEGFAAVKEAIKTDGGAYKFGFNNTSGQLEANIGELPGNIQDYYWVTENEDSAEYVVSFYFVTESGNISLVQNLRGDDPGYDTHGFRRQFAAVFNVPNVRNRFVVQKIDESDSPINGASFDLYSASDVDETGGTPKLKAGATPVATQTTRDLTQDETVSIDLNGAAVFEEIEISGVKSYLLNGEYYLVEKSAPAGYKINDTLTKVIVDNTGVYAYAGVANDGITVNRGAGTLLATMKQFATNDDIDTTLHDIVLTLQTGDPTADNPSWTDVAGADEVHLSYGAEDAALEYGPASEGGERSVWSDTGWPLARITQCYDCNQHDHAADTDKKTNLGNYFGNNNYNLRSLFSGTVTVRVANQQVNDLEISKDVTGYEGMDPAKLADLQKDKDFQFTLNLTFPDNAVDPDATYALNVLDAEGNKVGESVPVVKNGDTSFTLKHGQKAVIEDLPVGTKYTVTEGDLPSGFTSTPDTGNDADATVNKDQRTISGNLADADNNADNNTTALTPVTVSFTNAYNVVPVSTKDTDLSVKKVFEGREWRDTDEFEFWLTSSNEGPLPEVTGAMTSGTTPAGYRYVGIEVNNDNKDDAVTFGAIKFTKPGTYTYNVREYIPANSSDPRHIPGISYSQAIFSVVATVKDLGDGSMSVNLEIKKTQNDAGQTLANGGDVVQPNDVTFTNTYSENVEEWGFRASKKYNDPTGSKPVYNGQFKFKVKPLNGGPIPKYAQVLDDGSFEIDNTDGWITVEHIAFNDNDHVGTWKYEVTEQMPTEANEENKWTWQGMTYDPSVWTVTATVSKGGAADPIKVETSYERRAVDGTVTQPEQVLFENTYRPAGKEVKFSGIKTLMGRDQLSTDSFKFSISGANPITTGAIDDGLITFKEGQTAEVTDAQNRVPKTIDFGSVVFGKEGTFTFNISEVVPADDSDGMKWDRHTAVVTVEIKDNDGKLELDTSFDDDGIKYDNSTSTDSDAKNVTDKAAFVNTYAATGTSDLKGTKNITGRTFTGDESFTFKIDAGANNPADVYPSKAKDGKLTVKPQKGASSVELDFGTFTFNAEGTYTYTLTEEKSGTTEKGLKYDDAAYTLTIEVEDPDHNGTMKVTPSLTKIGDDQWAGDVPTWTNSYSASGTLTGSTHLEVTKVLTGRDWKDGDAFTFKIEPYSAVDTADTEKAVNVDKTVVMPTETTLTIDSTDKATSYKKAFGDITFTEPSVPNFPYAFKITEVVPADAVNWVKDGVKYDTHERIVYVTVRDNNNNGQLDVSIQRAAEGSAEWTNTYSSSVPAGQELNTDTLFTKVIDGRGWLDTDKFSFALTLVGDAPLRGAQGEM